MAIIREAQQKQLREKFDEMDKDVKIVVFKQETDCQYCEQTEELVQEIADLSDKISVEVYDFQADEEKVEQYNVDKVPAIVVEGEKDYGIRFYGIPAGYEFVSLLDAIMAVSAGKTDLSEKTKAALKKLKEPVRIQVFITLSCPYCPRAVEMAHKLAMESDLVTGDMVEASEFMELSQEYGVMAVPKMIVNEDIQFEGALPEKDFVAKVMEVL